MKFSFVRSLINYLNLRDNLIIHLNFIKFLCSAILNHLGVYLSIIYTLFLYF